MTSLFLTLGLLCLVYAIGVEHRNKCPLEAHDFALGAEVLAFGLLTVGLTLLIALP